MRPPRTRNIPTSTSTSTSTFASAISCANQPGRRSARQAFDEVQAGCRHGRPPMGRTPTRRAGGERLPGRAVLRRSPRVQPRKVTALPVKCFSHNEARRRRTPELPRCTAPPRRRSPPAPRNGILPIEGRPLRHPASTSSTAYAAGRRYCWLSHTRLHASLHFGDRLHGRGELLLAFAHPIECEPALRRPPIRQGGAFADFGTQCVRSSLRSWCSGARESLHILFIAI